MKTIARSSRSVSRTCFDPVLCVTVGKALSVKFLMPHACRSFTSCVVCAVCLMHVMYLRSVRQHEFEQFGANRFDCRYLYVSYMLQLTNHVTNAL